jgi:hypothetical protein
MSSAKTISVLNQLVRLHNRSLASYLWYASPTWHRGDETAKSTLLLIASQQQEIVDRAGELLVERDGLVNYGAYPMHFTGFHDLSFSFLLDRLIEEQQTIVGELSECVAVSQEDPRVHELVQEALGMAKGHLDSLRDLKGVSANV